MLSARRSSLRLRDVTNAGEALVLSIWVGAMTAFAFIFAPIAFHMLRDIGVFADLVEATLLRIDAVGIILGSIALILIFLSRSESGGARRPSRFAVGRVVCIVIMIAASVVESSLIIPQMHAILLHEGGALASNLTDPTRRAYDDAHHLSSLIYASALIAGYVAIVLRTLDAPRAAQ